MFPFTSLIVLNKYRSVTMWRVSVASIGPRHAAGGLLGGVMYYLVDFKKSELRSLHWQLQPSARRVYPGIRSIYDHVAYTLCLKPLESLKRAVQPPEA